MQGGSRARAGRARRPAAHASIIVALWLPFLATMARAAEPAPAIAPAARAAPVAPVAPELALAWQAPTGCPSSADVQAQFARLLGGSLRAPSGKRITASAVVRASPSDRWVLELATALDGAEGRRNLAGDSCQSVASAAALILALMIDPAAAERATATVERADTQSAPPAPPPTAPSMTLTTPPTTTAPATVTTKAAPAPPLALRPVARAFAGVVVALLPTPAAAAGVALGARRGRLGAELSFVATQERHAAAAELTGAGGDFRLFAGGARACGQLGGRVVVWELCLGAELERLAGAGTGIAVPRTQAVTMLAGAGGLLVTLPLGSRLALSLDLDAAVRPYHPAFVLDGVGRVFQIPMASAFAALGLSLTI
jgi:hypothetical protein